MVSVVGLSSACRSEASLACCLGTPSACRSRTPLAYCSGTPFACCSGAPIAYCWGTSSPVLNCCSMRVLREGAFVLGGGATGTSSSLDHSNTAVLRV